MNTSNRPINVAYAFVSLADNEGKSVTHLKAQKLVYFANGWKLALLNETMVDEEVQAFQYGPVYESMYHELKRYGREPIRLPRGFAIEKAIPNGVDRAVIEAVWDSFGELSAYRLSELTHAPDSPWREKYTNSAGLHNSEPIPTEEIRQYFQGELAKVRTSRQ